MNHALYKEHILELYRNPENKHVMEDATHACREHNPLCGDDLTLYLHVANGTIADASFTGTGCAISTAAASLLTHKLKGAAVSDLETMRAEDMIALLGIPVGPVRLKCALIALTAAQHALDDEGDAT